MPRLAAGEGGGKRVWAARGGPDRPGLGLRAGFGLRRGEASGVVGIVLGGEVGVLAAQAARHAGAGVVGKDVAVGLPGPAGVPAAGDQGFEGGVPDPALAARDVVRDGQVDQGLVGGVERHGARLLGERVALRMRLEG